MATNAGAKSLQVPRPIRPSPAGAGGQSYWSNTGMRECVLYDGDNATRDKICPHCHREFMGGQVIFESVDQLWAIHKSCLLELAAPALSEQDRHEETRQRILSTGNLVSDE